MTKSLVICGKSGRMGESLAEILSKQTEFSFLGGISKESLEKERLHLVTSADVILDFSSPDGNRALLKTLEGIKKESEKTLVIGTTGLEPETLDAWSAFAQNRQMKILFAPNTSLGILLSLKAGLELAKVCLAKGFDLEIQETHHRQKIDAPSGTALLLANTIAQKHDKKVVYGRKGLRKEHEIGISSTRGGMVFGEHELRFLSDDEEITITHRAFSRKIFAQGALYLASWLCGQKRSGIFSLDDVLLSQP